MSQKTQQPGTTTHDTPSLGEMMANMDPQKLQVLMKTMSEATQESALFMSEFMAAEKHRALPFSDPVGGVASYKRVGSSLAKNPVNLLQANQKLMSGWMQLMQDMASGNALNGQDKRFADPEWSANPAFDFIRRSYELNTDWMRSLIAGADDISDDDRTRALFYNQQLADAFSPTNFFATNPAALREMIATGGDSVLKGIRRARRDLADNDGELKISHTDGTPFEIGRNLATSPGKVVFRNDLIELIQYAPTKKTTFEKPLLIFPPWINKFYILDMREENSMIRWLVDKGLTVFIVSWRSADAATKDYTWDDYVRIGGEVAIDQALKASGADQLNAVGYCIGGTMLTGLLASMAKAKPKDKRVGSATFFASQSDFKEAGDLLTLINENTEATLKETIAENGGIMPGEAMLDTFNWLRPVDLVWRYVVDLYLLGKSPKPFDLLYWNSDQTNIPGKVHMQYLHDLYWKNDLAEGRFDVRGKPVDLGDIKIPAFVQAGRDDHICPWNSVYRTARAFGGKTQFCLAGSGHIAGVVNHPDAKKYQHWVSKELPERNDDWIAGAKEAPGSWWPEWWKWLRPKSGERVKAVKPKDVGLGDAPGSYVKVRLEDIHMPGRDD